LHSCRYRNPEQLPDGPALVVGGGNSGFQIALELAATRTVDLSIGTRNITVAQRPLGRDIFWWQTASPDLSTQRRTPVWDQCHVA
jgi:putative flavoprotein involved in K+ transport